MKIGETNRVGGAAAVRRTERSPTATSASSSTSGGVPDSAAVMGIPEAELTPKVHAAIMALMEEVGRLRGEIEQSRARISYLEKLADQDSLVPAVNRRAFVRELSRMMSFAERYNASSSILYFDINNMKQINDSHGHSAGDAALVHVGRILAENVRESDVVGRLGGDEFGVILAQADEEAAKEKAMTLAEAIETQAVEWEGGGETLSVAYGAYTFRGGDKPGEALDAADRDMYARKESFRAAEASKEG